jgi:hypothetical protein
MISLTEYMGRSPGERGAAPPYMKNPALYMKVVSADGSHPARSAPRRQIHMESWRNNIHD